MGRAQAQRAYEEAWHLGQWYRTDVEYDDEDGQWVHIACFPLPPGWDRPAIGLMLELPNGYPLLPPEGFYVDRNLRTVRGHGIDHFFERQSRLNPYASRGWGWFCIHLDRRAWRPTGDVRRGDNLLRVAVLIQTVMAEAVR
jgi:hypothetical protein